MELERRNAKGKQQSLSPGINPNVDEGITTTFSGEEIMRARARGEKLWLDQDQ